MNLVGGVIPIRILRLGYSAGTREVICNANEAVTDILG